MSTKTDATINLDLKGGTTLLDGTTAAATVSGTATYLGKGFFLIKYVIADIETASGDEHYQVDVMANSIAASTTYRRIGQIGHFGGSALIGTQTADVATSGVVGIYNSLDYQVWVRVGVVGTIAGTGLNISATAYPVNLIA